MKKKNFLRILSLICALCTISLASCESFLSSDFFDSELNSGTSSERETEENLSGENEQKQENEQESNGDKDIEPDGNPPATAISTFEKKEYTADSVTLKYWLYTPKNATENMPLIVYLHGGSGKGDDLELITSVDGFPQYLKDGKLTPNAYVIIPQVSSAYRGWGEMKAEVIKLISFVQKQHKINEKQISLTGHSMGGTGAWMLALAYPNTFSAVAPLSGSVTLSDVNINKLKNMPVWAVVGTQDTIVEPQSSINFINKLAEVNDKAKLTELNGADHFAVPSMTYLSKEFNVVEWLISNTK